VGHALPAGGLQNRVRQVATRHAGPVIRAPFDGIEQRLPPQRPEARLESVIDRPCPAIGSVDERGVTARLPFLAGVERADERVVRAILPRPCTERDRAAMTMWLVAGPAVPPIALMY
jgi:hypothetical protein